MFVYRNKTALVTGASSGIGETFVRALAARGMHVVLVARSEERLRALASEISRDYDVRAEVLAADLSQPQMVQLVSEEVERRGLVIDLLVNNAGFATHGAFETLLLERDHQEIMVNIAALVDLTHAFVPSMIARGGGAVINVSSTAGFQPLPYMAVYGASKAFVLSFSLALSQEYRQRGLRVLALCPGATQTAFFDVVGTDDASVGRRRTSEQVVATGLRALEQGRSVVIDGQANALLARLTRQLPLTLAAWGAGQTIKPRNAQTVRQATAR